MFCPFCRSPIADNLKHCPFCGNELRFKTRYTPGKLSIILAFSGLVGSLILLLLIRVFWYGAVSFAIFFSNILMILAVLSIILGAYAFFKQQRDVFGLIGLYLGLLLMFGLLIGSSLALSYSQMSNYSEYGYIRPMEYIVRLYFPW
ncbi:MAG: zinc ribbon domain-containing protein [Candidatus Thermoplasmatota archaeon]|nr:zinc ribbon domain-containing protein [Candidatus Thermoplasmatota archaeon]